MKWPKLIKRNSNDAREKLIGKLRQLKPDLIDSNVSNPVVSIEDYFEGNDDQGSICYNVNEHPGLEAIHGVLKTIRGRLDVQDVLVSCQFEDENVWPYSSHLYIYTSATKTDVECWVDVIRQDEISEGWFFGVQPLAAPDPLPRMRVDRG